MRILHVNWVDMADPAGRGGGVRVYAQALMHEQTRAGHACTSLATGMAHDLKAGAKARWERLAGNRYHFVNARPLSPSHAEFAADTQIDHPETEALFRDFIERTGPYDVVHFHALEGLPAKVLALRADLPRTRFILSLHNYYPFCPQVNLWWQERAHCEDFLGGARCTDCLPLRPDPSMIRRAYAVETTFARFGAPPGSWLHDRVLRLSLSAGWRAFKAIRARKPDATAKAPSPKEPDGAAFARRRAAMVELINAHCDSVLAVSDRVRDIAAGFGVTKARTLYIGTRHAEAWGRTAPRPVGTSPLRLAYLGYMRADKGFGFLLDALDSLPDTTLARLHLTVAARKGPAAMMQQMQQLAPRLAGLEWRDGYAPKDLDRLAAQTDIGIVPPLWEDNLPQVALELHARHVPLVISDRGGAQELPGTRELVFRAGDRADFARVIAKLLLGDVDLAAYWAHARAPVDMAAHADALAPIYRGQA